MAQDLPNRQLNFASKPVDLRPVKPTQPIVRPEKAMYKTVGEALYALGHVNTIWIHYNDIGRKVIGGFNRNEPFDGRLVGDYSVAFERRYGAGSWNRKGDLVGERMSPDLVESIVRRPDNPLNLENHLTFLTVQDLTDVKMVKSLHGSRLSVYDSFFVPGAPVVQQPDPPKPVEPPVVQPPKPIDLPTTAQYEYLSYWLGISTSQAFDIIKTNVRYFKALSFSKPAAHTANVIIQHLTVCWRAIKNDLL